jgi:hypothetical protein
MMTPSKRSTSSYLGALGLSPADLLPGRRAFSFQSLSRKKFSVFAYLYGYV